MSQNNNYARVSGGSSPDFDTSSATGNEEIMPLQARKNAGKS